MQCKFLDSLFWGICRRKITTQRCSPRSLFGLSIPSPSDMPVWILRLVFESYSYRMSPNPYPTVFFLRGRSFTKGSQKACSHSHFLNLRQITNLHAMRYSGETIAGHLSCEQHPLFFPERIWVAYKGRGNCATWRFFIRSRDHVAFGIDLVVPNPSPPKKIQSSIQASFLSIYQFLSIY